METANDRDKLSLARNIASPAILPQHRGSEYYYPAQPHKCYRCLWWTGHGTRCWFCGKDHS